MDLSLSPWDLLIQIFKAFAFRACSVKITTQTSEALRVRVLGMVCAVANAFSGAWTWVLRV